MKNLQIKQYVLCCIMMVIFHACNNNEGKKIICYPNGKPHKIIHTYKDRLSYSFVETFDPEGYCIEKAEFQDLVLNGKRVVYNPLTSSVLTQYYVQGKKHGIERMAVDDKSHERLFLNDTVIVLKVYGTRSSERDTNEIIQRLYKIVRFKGGELICDDGEIVLKGNSFISIYDLKREDIDMSETLWYFDNLPDTVPHGNDIEFDIELSVLDPIANPMRYLFSKIALFDFNSNFEMTSKSKYKYESPQGVKILKGRINVPEVGYKIVTGIIEQTYLNEMNRDTVCTYQIFYKQVYIK
jgi:hypothetical protein